MKKYLNHICSKIKQNMNECEKGKSLMRGGGGGGGWGGKQK